MKDRPYGRYAFLNPYNLVLFTGAVVLGFLLEHEWLAVVASGAELIWLIYAPGSKFLRRRWFDPAFERAERDFVAHARGRKCATMTPPGRERVGNLVLQQTNIERLARENHSLAVDLLQGELTKLDALIDEFIERAAAAERAEQYIGTFDLEAMRRSWNGHLALAKAAKPSDPRRTVAEQNLEILRQRRVRYDDLCRSIQVARGQMELVEQTFRLLADEILTMASPSELSGRIDELRIAVEAARETTEDSFMTLHEDDVVLEEMGVHEGHR